MNYYRRYVGDYLRDTSRLSLLEHGAYTMLLDYYYAEERPIPLDLDEVYRMVRAIEPPERRAIVKVLTTFFRKDEDGYHNPRADHEIEVSKGARENGGKGGRKKTGKVTGSDTGNETGEQTGKRTGLATGLVSKEGGGSGHPPTTNLQPPSASLQTATPQPAKNSAAARRSANGESGVEVWNAYAGAYQHRYSVAPVRNAKVNGMLARFVERVGAAEAPGIAEFYVRHGKGLYVSARHCVDLLLRDAEGLRTEWATGRRVTDTEARQIDKTSARGDQAARLLAEAEEAGRSH